MNLWKEPTLVAKKVEDKTIRLEICSGSRMGQIHKVDIAHTRLLKSRGTPCKEE